MTFGNFWKKSYKPSKNSEEKFVMPYEKELKFRKTSEDVLRCIVTNRYVDIYRLIKSVDDKYASDLADKYRRNGSVRVPIERINDIIEIANAELEEMGILDRRPNFEDCFYDCLEEIKRG